jgi:formate hydrogenlyase subunit 6/NADH:ubiquinone oxidoreductase subunit I
VSVCPVDCIYRYTGEDHEAFPNQLFIDPEECIDCGACEPECPWGSIFEEAGVPEIFAEDTALNSRVVELKDDFEVCEHEEKEKPTAEEVEQNKARWGLQD